MTFAPHRHAAVRLAAALAATLGLAVGPTVLAAAPASADGATIVVRPGVDLQDAMRDLLPGDTLLLAPGTYRQVSGGSGKKAGVIRPAAHGKRTVTPGTAAAPITVRAQDPRNRPLIQAHVRLWGANFWRLDNLRIQTVVAGEDALTMVGGIGWRVTGSEIWGARRTGAYSNVAISSDPAAGGAGAPRGFLFQGNCVHDAANVVSRPAPTDHNLYLNFQGTPGSGGRIDRNIIYGSPNGAGIKLGYGGAPRARGPWGVKVTNNTVADGGYQILLHGDVRNNTFTGNLFSGATQKFSKLPKTTAVYVHDVVGTKNVFDNNYASGASFFSYGKTATVTRNNGLRPDPRMNTRNSCSGYQPRVLSAKKFGRGAIAAPRG